MPLNYSKFDHLVDSDDEKPDPQAAAEARRKMLEEMRAKVEDSEGSKASSTDRFSYAEGDCNEVAQELLKLCVAKAPSVKVANGVLSVALVEKVEGEASTFQDAALNRQAMYISITVSPKSQHKRPVSTASTRTQCTKTVTYTLSMIVAFPSYENRSFHTSAYTRRNTVLPARELHCAQVA